MLTHLTYIWQDIAGNLRQKVKIEKMDHTDFYDASKYPIWNFDGSSTGQATRQDSEVLLYPIRIYNNKFRQATLSFIVLCECRTPNHTPHPTNHRAKAIEIFDRPIEICMTDEKDVILKQTAEQYYEPWFGIEQEFFVIDRNTGQPVGFQSNETQGKYYCSVSSTLNNMLNKMLDICCEFDLGVTGSNMEVAPGQAEIQLLSQGLKACDDLLILRYIITTVANDYNYDIDYYPKILDGDWNGSGAHVNYSTKFMRQSENKNNDPPYQHIMHTIEQFKEHHEKHISVYGDGNDKRLTGEHETSDLHTFTYGIADRGVSVRIPRTTHENGFGYIEDRRPSSNFNPYLVLPLIFETSIIGLTEK